MKPTEMVLRPALKLAYLLAVATVAACVTLLLLLPLSMPLRLGLVLLVSWLAVYLIRRDVLLALPHSWQSVTLNSKDEIVMTQKNGQHFVCQVLPDSVVFRHLTVLRLKLNDRFWPRSLILLAGSADADELRRWRIWLRWGIKVGKSLEAALSFFATAGSSFNPSEKYLHWFFRQIGRE